MISPVKTPLGPAPFLYQMPLALIGLISSLALWDIFKFCSEMGMGQISCKSSGFDSHCSICLLVYLNVQMTLFCAIGVSYAVIILHAAFRKLTPTKHPSRRR